MGGFVADIFLRDVKEGFRNVEKSLPEEMKLFNDLYEKVFSADKHLDKKTKMLIAIGISVETKCPYCIPYYVEKAMKCGATKEEIMSAGSVAIAMGGGPAITYVMMLEKAVNHVKENLTARV